MYNVVMFKNQHSTKKRSGRRKSAEEVERYFAPLESSAAYLKQNSLPNDYIKVSNQQIIDKVIDKMYEEKK